MPEERIEVVVTLKDREPICFECDPRDPVLEQLCAAMANRDRLGFDVMQLNLGGTDFPYVYFPVSAIVAVESSSPLPERLFLRPEVHNAEDYFHLNMDRKWIEWAVGQLNQGREKASIYETMRESGVDQHAISELLNYVKPNDTAPLELTDRESVVPLAAPAGLGQYRLDSEYIEIYSIGSFIDAKQCAEFRKDIDSELSRSKIHGDKPMYEGRTSHTHRFQHCGEVLPVVDGFQRRVADLLQCELACLEPIQGNVYSEGQQFRAHIDYFPRECPAYTDRDGNQRNGQRQWSVAVYLNEIDAGSGIRFPRASIEIDPAPGSAIIWNNIYPSGNPNPYSLHEGLRAGKQAKYMLVQFVRFP